MDSIPGIDGNDLSPEEIQYLEAAFMKLISEEVQNKYANWEEFYTELQAYGNKVKETESGNFFSTITFDLLVYTYIDL